MPTLVVIDDDRAVRHIVEQAFKPGSVRDWKLPSC
jgi:hypothetical protein